MLLSIGKTPVNKVKSVANDSAKTESSIGAGLHFVDNRPEAVAYRRIQAIKNSHSQMKSAQLKVMNDKSIQGTSNIEITYVELPYKLDSRLNNKSIVQREKFKVEAQEEDDTITGIKISGRPDVKARKNELNDQLALKHPQDFTEKKLNQGLIKAHIIGWNVKQREYLNGLHLPKTKQELIKAFSKDDFSEVIQQIKYELTNIFYDLDNYTINTEKAEQDDRLILRSAGQKYSQTGKPEDLKDIYIHSFNTGKSGDGAPKAEEYMNSFSKAYNINIDILKSWNLRIPQPKKEKIGESGRKEEGKTPSSSKKENTKEENSNDYYTFGNGFQNHSEKWIEEAYNAYNGLTNLWELSQMLMIDYKSVDTRMQKIYEVYLKKILGKMTISKEIESWSKEIGKLKVFLGAII